MRNVRRAGAFCSGVLLYSAAVGISAFLAGLKLPGWVYVKLGGRTSLTFAYSEATVIALLLLVIAMLWAYITIRPAGPLRRGHRPTTGWCLGGVGFGWLSWTIYGAIYFSLSPRSYSQPLTTLLLSSVTPPLWGVLNTVGVVLGAALAGLFASRVREAARGYGRPRARYSKQPIQPAAPLAKMVSIG